MLELQANYLFIRILSLETVSSDRTMQTVSFRFLPLRSTESPLNNSNSSILAWDKATTELSSFAASSTISRLGRSFFFKMAVAKSSPLERPKVRGFKQLKNEQLTFRGRLLLFSGSYCRLGLWISSDEKSFFVTRRLNTGRDKALLNGVDEWS